MMTCQSGQIHAAKIRFALDVMRFSCSVPVSGSDQKEND